MSDIRVTYSGLIAFFVGIIGVFTGLIFVLMVTRRLTPEEFGIWTLIGSVVTYFLISESVISFWTTRQIARNEDVGKNALITSGMFSIVAIPIYIIYISFIAEKSGTELSILFLGAILLPVNFLSQSITAINLGHKPQATSFSMVLFETIKIPAALAFVVIFDAGVVGAILAVFLAFVAKLFLQIYYAKPRLRDALNYSKIGRWIRLVWIPGYQAIPKTLQNLDIALYSIITGSVLGIAYYQAAYTVSALVNHSSLISQALYTKILAKEDYDLVKENFVLSMYFAIPLLAISILFAKPALFALNPAYQEGWMIVILLSLKMFVYVLRIIPIYILFGTEKADVEHKPKFRILLKSKLFIIPTVTGIFHLSYIVSIVALFNTENMNEIDTVTFWALIGLLIEIPLSLYMWIWVYRRKLVKFAFPYQIILKYGGVALLFSLVFFFTEENIIHYEISIFKFLPTLLLELAICVIIYLGITYFIDNRTKELFKSIFNEITNNS